MGYEVAAQAGMSAYNGLLGYIGQSNTNKMNQQIAREQNLFDLQMWNKSNLYNSPEEQMKRLEEAGLNPNLVYGSGNVSGQSSSQAPKAHDYSYTAPMMALKLPDILAVLSQYADYQQKTAQVDVTKQQIAVNDANIALNNAKLLTEAERKRLTSSLANKAFYDQAYANERGWYNTQFIDAELRSKIADADTREFYLKNILPHKSSILSSEAWMNSSLKDKNMTSADAVWARILALFLDKFGISDKLFDGMDYVKQKVE